MPRFALQLEDIRPALPKGADVWALLLGGSLRARSRAWCAEIVAFSERYGFKRRFFKPTVDYSESNSVGSRGVHRYYWLEDGKIYDVSEPVSWRKTARYYCRVEGEKLIELTKEQVEAWLKDHLELPF